MIKFTIYGSNQAKLIEQINALDPTKRHLATIRDYTDLRSDLQNKLSHAWYGELAHELKEHDAIGYKCLCKLHHGVPIMRTDDDEFRAVYDTAIKGLSYEQKIEVMKILPVTSLMNTKQLTQYLDAVKTYFYEHNGFDLKYPNDW